MDVRSAVMRLQHQPGLKRMSNPRMAIRMLSLIQSCSNTSPNKIFMNFNGFRGNLRE